jgi:hypothetical protein
LATRAVMKTFTGSDIVTRGMAIMPSAVHRRRERRRSALCWTAAARAERATEITEPELPWALVHELVTRLEPWPEARVAVAEWLMGTCRQEGTKDTIQVYSSGADETSDTGAAE